MKVERRRIGVGVALVVSLVVAACSGATEGSSAVPTAGSAVRTATTVSGPLTRDQQVDLAAQAYVFGLPLVITRRTMATFTGTGPLNQLLRAPSLATPQSKAVVAPNRDTLYLFAPIDVTAEPLILKVPAVTDRYFAIQFLDAYTDVFDYLGTRTDGAQAGTYAVTGPDWHGSLPDGVKPIRMRTPQGVLLGRVRVRNDSDLDSAHAIQNQVTLTSLDAYLGQPETAAPVTLPPRAGTAQNVADAGIGFFDELGDGLAANPPTTDAQRELVTKLAAIGVGPGRLPSTDVTDPADRSIFDDGIKAGEAQIADAGRSLGTLDNGWRVNTELGRYGDDLARRAAVAQVGWGANGPEEAVYPSSATDPDGQAYTGAKRYVMHFDAGRLPPVKDLGFWSLTVYTPDRFLIENPIHRYNIGGDTPGLVTNPDGSLDIYLQHDAPIGHEANWLPTPDGAFTLALRLYLPEASATDGTYEYPPVRAVG